MAVYKVILNFLVSYLFDDILHADTDEVFTFDFSSLEKVIFCFG